MYSSTFGFTAEEYKKFKGLQKKESLRDNMTPLELASTIFSEATSTELLKKSGSDGFWGAKETINKAGKITKEAIEKIKEETGEDIITKKNNKALNNPKKQKDIIHGENNEKELIEFDRTLDAIMKVPKPDKKK